MEPMGTKMGKLTLDKPMEWFNWMNASRRVPLGLALLTAALSLGSQARGQELELDLRSVFVPQTEMSTMPSLRSGGGGDALPPMGLPFVDDFAWPSMSHEEGLVTICLLYTSPSPRDRG